MSLELTNGSLTAGLDSPCAGRDYRTRSDLHATERALIAAVAPLCGNSARGGFHHEPELAHFGTVKLPAFDDPNDPATIQALQRINADVEEHLRDARTF